MADLATWDARTVGCADGHVQQSLAWGEHRARTGSVVHHLVVDDAPVLAVGRPWPLIGGGRLHVPKGPIGNGAPVEVVAERLMAVGRWAVGAGYDAVVADAEIVAASGYGALLAARGFRPAPEVGPSQHRVGIPLAVGATEEALLERIERKMSQRFHSAEKKGYRVVRLDARAGTDPGPGFEAPAPDELPVAAADAFDRFHGVLVATGERRGFSVGPRSSATAWWRAALAAGHLALLEVRSPADDYLGAGIFYRNGARLTYSHSGDVVERRHDFPGTTPLMLWRALQLAIREGAREFDLGGVDVAGARQEPREGDEMYGLYRFKRQFAGEWIELAGTHERVLRPGRLRLGTAAGSAMRVARGVARRARSVVGGSAR